LSPLEIPSAAGLVEQVHIVFFPRNLVGADFNFYGPRLSRLEDYFAARGDDLCPLVAFEPLLRQDVAEQLERLADIRLFQLRIHVSYIDTVTQANRDLGSAFEAAKNAGLAQEVEIILSPRAYSRRSLSQKLFSTARRLLAHRNLLTEASRFRVKGMHKSTGRVELLDLLSDQLIVKKRIFRENPRTRALDRGSAYAAIQEAYDELRDQLLAAASAQA